MTRSYLVAARESMSRAPFVLEKATSRSLRSQQLWNTSIGWRMLNLRLRADWTISNGESADELAEIYHISREAQDQFAVRSHRLAAAAPDGGMYDTEIVQVEGSELPRDEGIRALLDRRDPRLPLPAFNRVGTVTAGNSSPINDGASAVLVGGEGVLGAEPLARVAGRGVFGNDPDVFGIAPVEAANRALKRADRTWADVDFVELNEAFASQSLACLRLWTELDPEKVNIHGGAIAIGHPLGASGGRIIGHAAHELKRRGRGVAVAAICIGVGQGLAIVLER